MRIPVIEDELRMQELLRQGLAEHDYRESPDGPIFVGDTIVDSMHRSVMRSGQSIRLGPQEFLLLECLARHAGECVPRQVLIDSVCGSNYPVEAGVLDVLINSLRSKFDAIYAAKLISTVRGGDFLFKKDSVAHKRASR
ncbi:MAG: winged helix-turn-helix domain-containing protein [Terracidiphilus sp.]|jgi:DNA-binding response OmpR family regulator